MVKSAGIPVTVPSMNQGDEEMKACLQFLNDADSDTEWQKLAKNLEVGIWTSVQILMDKCPKNCYNH